MSEPSEIRLVRCPKCENLLPELKDYSVYQCGGCGAVLRAENRNLVADTLSQISDEERVQGLCEKISEKSDNNHFSEKGMNMSAGAENDVKSNGNSFRRADKREVLSNTAEDLRTDSSIAYDHWVVDNDRDTNKNLNESSLAENRKEFEWKPPSGISTGSRRSGWVADWRSGEGGEIEGFWREQRRDSHGVGYSTHRYSEDGPSNYMRSRYGSGESVKNNQNKSDEVHRVEYLEQDRAELLRKLDELKDQLSRSCDVKDKPKENFPLDRKLVQNEEPYSGSETWFQDKLWASNRPHHMRHYPEPFTYLNTQEMEMHKFYPPMHAPNQFQRLGDTIRPQMLRAAPHQAPGAFQQQLSHTYFSGQYIDHNINPYEPYPPNMNFHHPSCSCFHCYNYPRVPAPIPPTAFCNKMFPNVPNNLMFYQHENQSPFGPREHEPKIGNHPPLNSNNPQSDTRWPSDLNSELGGFLHRHPPRVVLATRGRRCHPIAGGAPFVTCYTCFELLQLPKKILLIRKSQKKVRCGGCSTVILFAVVNKKLVVSVHAEPNRTPEMVDDGANVMVSGGTLHSHVRADQGGMNFSSDDYDNSGYDFQPMDREVVSLSTGQGICSSKSGEMKSMHSTSPYSSEDEDNPDSLNAQVEESNCVEPAAKSTLSPPSAGSPLQDHFEYSNKYNVVNRFGKGNQSGRSEQEKGDPKKVTSRQNSMKDASLATEMEVSFNEYSNTGASQESGDTSREEDQVRVNKGGQSFFAGIIKKSFKDFSRSTQTIDQSSTNVMINGHPMSNHLLKKAEKLAGPIHPGQYWYDSRAGFWGVMGGPCLGIIPPFIEEFSSPMPENCAGGNTGVFVNGRELHQKDLNLLSSRGLPTTSNRSYIIDISGRVLDEDSGEELDSLGKLAPTIEKVKHGFGMKVPRIAAA